jgi:DNA-damage-inducible protein J
MAAKTAYLNTRIDETLKVKAEKVFSNIGINSSTAVTMFFRQVVMHQGLPFDARIPNATTRAAMREIEAGGGDIIKSSTAEAFDEILRGDKNRRA